MKIYLRTLIGIYILMVSCKQKETPNIVTENKYNKTVIAEQYIENDSLFILLKSNLYTIAFNPIFNGEELPKSNIKNETSDATNKTLVFEQTKIHFYKEGFIEEIISATIKNSQFKFLDSISIGIKIETLEKQIGTELKTNLINILNFDKKSIFTFKFEEGLLKEINYED
ncbi:hypothetical protein [Lacinutrix jangbogonensis]|uniref:hypothetical protein n=1 Tax=Lacinutrix jangbogonensis TaxID=1469557 RepID=UPI00053EFBCA|nr:hypothetical protein [Lacinutrix jangbogonensis]